MPEQQEAGGQVQFLLTDFNTRHRDIDERNRLIRERVLLLGKNLISSRQDVEDELKEIKKDNQQIKKDIDEIKKTNSRLISEFSKFIKREEILLIERMLKDFQPLEFMRKKDVEELIGTKTKKEINTTKPTV
jgi:predicted  nucleic acid-binding Zn-ribbon protein